VKWVRKVFSALGESREILPLDFIPGNKTAEPINIRKNVIQKARSMLLNEVPATSEQATTMPMDKTAPREAPAQQPAKKLGLGSGVFGNGSPVFLPGPLPG
jgi:hypothetical protein